jgi:phosphosulfolactate synthase
MSRDRMAFLGVPSYQRPGKPRDTGITMMIDWGLPVGLQTDILDMAGALVDLAKIAVGVSGVLPLITLRTKIEAYRRADVDAFPGGMFLEYAHASGRAAEYFDGCAEAGYRMVEVSDNAVPLSRREKTGLIQTALNRGMRVLGEAGSKHTRTSPSGLAEDITACLEAGAWKVFVEAAELFEEGAIRGDLLDHLTGRIDQSQVIWELPGSWISGVHSHQIHQLQVWLIEHLGPEVNVANVDPLAVVALETLRRGIGVRALVGRHPGRSRTAEVPST